MPHMLRPPFGELLPWTESMFFVPIEVLPSGK